MNRTEQTAADILTTAVEGGINYWSCVSDVVRDEDLNILSVTIHEEVDDDTPAEQTLGSSHPLNFARYKEQGIKVDWPRSSVRCAQSPTATSASTQPASRP